MQNHAITRKGFKKFARAVLLSAAALGLTYATACADSGGYYVAYRTPNGYLTCTEPSTTEKGALYSFEKALFSNILNGH